MESFRCEVQVQVRFTEDGVAHVRAWSAQDDWSAIVPGGMDPFMYAHTMFLQKFPDTAEKAARLYWVKRD